MSSSREAVATLGMRAMLAPWSEFDRGGHFAAMEAPDLLVDDVRAFFRTIWPIR